MNDCDRRIRLALLLLLFVLVKDVQGFDVGSIMQSEKSHRKRLDECDCLNCGFKKCKSEVTSSGDSSNVASGDTCTKSARKRSVSLLKRIGGNILHNLGPGHRSKIATTTTQHQVYRAFEEDPITSPSLHSPSSYPPSLRPISTVTKETITTDKGANKNRSDFQAFSMAVNSTSNVADDRDRYLYRSLHHYVYSPLSYQGNSKYAIERKHKVKKRDLLQKQKLPEPQQIEKEFRREHQKQMKRSCETFPMIDGKRTVSITRTNE
uniref:Uncharacterized protein n=1 Tax=Anopheles minimus TaxID=112268 RepID=A0A182WIZ7_9DIPT